MPNEIGYLGINPLYSEGKALILAIKGNTTIAFAAEYEDVERLANYILAYMGWWRMCRILLEILKEIVAKEQSIALTQEAAAAVTEAEKIIKAE